MTWTPERVRQVRGAQSRAAFARAVGVTPLTIYRWELAPTHGESRRPRARYWPALAALERVGHAAHERDIAALGGGGDLDVSAQGRGEPGPRDEPHSIVRLRDTGQWSEVERAGVAALTRGVGGHVEAVALAEVRLLVRGDLRGALSILAPMLSVGAVGSGGSLARAQALAAVVLASADGELFDPARAAALAARVRDASVDADVLAVAAAAEAWAAWHDDDRALFLQVMARRRGALQAARAVGPRVLAQELTALETTLGGRLQLAERQLAAALSAARRAELQPAIARLGGQLALLRLLQATRPEGVLTLLDELEPELAGLVPCYGRVQLTAARAEALLRQARLRDAWQLTVDAQSLAERLRWPPVALLFCQTRVLFDVAGREAVSDWASWWRSCAADVDAGGVAAAVAYSRAIDRSFEPDLTGAADDMGAAAERAADGVTPWLEVSARLLQYAYLALAGSAEATEVAARAMRHALDHHPSGWHGALADHIRGIHLCRLGRAVEAYQRLQACVATLTLAGDQPEAARGRRAYALAARLLGHPDADRLLAESEQELRDMGVQLGPAQTPLSEYPHAPVVTLDPGVGALVVAVQRLRTRGVGLDVLQREVVAVVADLLAAPRGGDGDAGPSPRAARRPVPVQLLEVDPQGGTTALTQGPHVAPYEAHVDFSDGCGRCLRVALGVTPSAEQWAQLRVVCATASLAIEATSLRAEAAPASTSPPPVLEGVVARSALMQALFADVARVARSRSTVLIVGESGVGKEVVAHAVHSLSPRKAKPYVTFNSATVPAELFEGQLFGYRKGAFTGAARDHLGVIRAAEGGTLFLDEIGDMPRAAQAKLLRFLENREVQPLGAASPVTVDVRVVAATHRDLQSLVREGQFREDLYYRLQVVPLEVPPLRARREDIAPLAQHFIARAAEGRDVTLTVDALRALQGRDWPGNVRQLRNVLERALAFEPDTTELRATHLR